MEAILPFVGVNRYGYLNWCDFHWNDKTPSGSAFVFLYAIEGKCCRNTKLSALNKSTNVIPNVVKFISNYQRCVCHF